MKNKIRLIVLLTALSTPLAFGSYVQAPYSVPKGGTGVATLTAHAVLLGEGTSSVASASPTQYESLIGNASGDPSFQAIPLSQSAAVTGQLGVPNGGTGAASFIANGILFGSGTSAIGVTAAGSQYQVCQAGSGGTPQFGALALAQSAAVTGQLLPANGGTGLSSITAHNILVGNGTSAANLIGPGTSGQILTSNGASADPSFQAAPGVVYSVVDSGDAPYSILAANNVVRDTTPLTAGRAWTLPVCNASNIGEHHILKNTPGQTFNVTVTAAGSDTVDGSATYVLNPGDSVSVSCDLFTTVGTWDIY